MRAVDTNVLVRLMVRDDESQVVAAERFVADGVWISQLVLAETVWVLKERYDLDHSELAATIEMLLNEKHVTLQDVDVVVAALRQYRDKPALGFTDCMVLEIARHAGHLPLGTFDRALARLDGAERL